MRCNENRLGLAMIPLIAIALASCIPSRSASEAALIQNTKGAWSKSLYYEGSATTYHYFDQKRIPSFPWQGYDRKFRVPKEDLVVPPSLYFERASRSADGIQKKVRIVGPPYRLIPRKPLKEKLERFNDEVHDATQ